MIQIRTHLTRAAARAAKNWQPVFPRLATLSNRKDVIFSPAPPPLPMPPPNLCVCQTCRGGYAT